jgi:hypothetical protein
MTPKQIKLLFLFSLLAILIIYSLFLGEVRTIGLIIDEYPFLLALIPLWITTFFYKKKLKDYELIDFYQNSGISLKSTVLFFLAFQMIDYIYEDGFIGMISQWFLYWIMGLVSFMVLNILNYHKNYKLLKRHGMV